MTFIVTTSMLNNNLVKILLFFLINFYIFFPHGYIDEKEIPNVKSPKTILFRGWLNVNLKAINRFTVVLTTEFIMTLLHPFLLMLMLCSDTASCKFWFSSILLSLQFHHCINRSMYILLFRAWNWLFFDGIYKLIKITHTFKMLSMLNA